MHIIKKEVNAIIDVVCQLLDDAVYAIILFRNLESSGEWGEGAFFCEQLELGVGLLYLKGNKNFGTFSLTTSCKSL